MYAHVNVWRLTDEGAEGKDDAARVVGAALEGQPGFRSYTLVRTGEWEVVAITMFDSRPELDAAVATVAPLVRQRVAPLAEGVLERRQGSVVYHNGS
jgi:heme-degrading monooxygenase HmoA